MTRLQIVLAFIFVFVLSIPSRAQHADSTLDNLQQIPTKYIKDIDKKINQYRSRIKSKTEKTLTKLSRWETKIQTILQKVNPEASELLFGNGQLTFTSLLQKIKQGEAVALQYQQQYDKYRDDLTTSLKYIEQQKENINSGVLKKITDAKGKMQELNASEDSTEALQQFVKQRKKELITTAFQYLGKNKYLSKINQEGFSYAETMKNYKEIFRDEKKAEQAAKDILNKVPAFQKFLQQNSMLASLFGQPGDAASTVSLAGLQTRASVQGLIQGRIAAGGPNAQQLISQNIQAAQSQLSKLKDKMLKGTTGNDTDIPEFDFKPKMEKTKTFLQRLEYGTDMQFGKSNNLMPPTADIGLRIGYKINDKSVAGIGASYKLGTGTIHKIRFSNQGVNLRTFIDWKLKKQFFLSGGMELNYLSALPQVEPLNRAVNGNNWQQAALLGVSKKISIKTKWFKETKMQLLYDFLAKQHVPVSQALVFRVGYNF